MKPYSPCGGAREGVAATAALVACILAFARTTEIGPVAMPQRAALFSKSSSDRVFRRGTQRARRGLRALVASHDIYGLLFAAASRNRHGLRGATLHIGSFRRCDSRRKSMRPIPGNIIGVGVTEIARYRLRSTYHGFAIRRPVEEAPCCRPQGPYIVSPVMPD